MNFQYAYAESEIDLPFDPGHDVEEALQWFALSVSARHEKSVALSLNHKGFETFLPLYTRRHRYEGRVRQFELPLFPGYVFCRMNPSTRLPILTTPGVLRMVGAGRTPVPIENEEVQSLQRAMQAGISMSPFPFWRSGQVGRITAGPLAGIAGIVTNVKQSLRLVLSVTLLQRSVLLEIDSGYVALA